MSTVLLFSPGHSVMQRLGGAPPRRVGAPCGGVWSRDAGGPPVAAGSGGDGGGGAGGAMNAERDLAPLAPSVVRALNDKLYEKRKVAALEIEK